MSTTPYVLNLEDHPDLCETLTGAGTAIVSLDIEDGIDVSRMSEEEAPYYITAFVSVEEGASTMSDSEIEAWIDDEIAARGDLFKSVMEWGRWSCS